jgi:putative addiction module component (TIGR02574 family)
MSAVADRVLEQGLTLPPDERLRVAEELLQSIRSPQQRAIDEAWAAVAERRVAEVRDGKVQTLPADEVIDETLAWLQSLRK